MSSIQEIAKELNDNWEYFIAAILITAPICWAIVYFLEKARNQLEFDKLNNKNRELTEENSRIKRGSYSPKNIQSNEIFLSCSKKLSSSVRFSKVFEYLQSTTVSSKFNIFKNKGPFPPSVDWSVYYFHLNRTMSTCCALFIIIDDELANKSNCNERNCFETEYDCAFFKNLYIYTFIKESIPSCDSVKRIISLQLAPSIQYQVAKKITHCEFKDEVDLLTAFQDSILHLSLRKDDLTEQMHAPDGR